MKLTKARFSVLTNILDSVKDSLYRAETYHNAELSAIINAEKSSTAMCYEFYQENRWHVGDIYDINDTYVVVNWEQSRRNCTVARGSTLFPIDALCDDSYKQTIDRIVAEKAAKYQAKRNAMFGKERADKLQQYEQLKKELGGSNNG